MEIKLSEYLTEKILYSRAYKPNFDTTVDFENQQTVIESENFTLNINEQWFNGIHISIVQITVWNEFDFLLENSISHINLLFCLKGSFNCFSYPKASHLRTIKKKQHHIALSDMDKTVFNVSENVHYIHLRLTQEYYKKITNEDFAVQQNLFSSITTSTEMNLLLTKLCNQSYTGRAGRLYLESKIFELIIIFIEGQTDGSTSLKPEDLNKISLAKKIVEENIRKPFSLIELSRKAGINDFKLKKGFKELTGLTVFGYIFKLRMEKAYHLLLQEKKQVNEVSFLVGYKNPQHFTTAFKKYYKLLPGSLNK